MKPKILLSLMFILLLVGSVSAVWWNPFTWFGGGDDGLTDYTVYNALTNVCTGERGGMNIEIYPCKQQDVDGKAISQFVNFKWTGINPQSVSWVFAYSGELESGKMYLQQNQSYIVTEPVEQYLTGVVINNVIGFVNLTGQSANCDIGTARNDQKFRVTRNTANGTIEKIYCFMGASSLGGGSYSLDGYVNVDTQVTKYKTVWNDITSNIIFMGNNLTGRGLSFYKVQDVNFNPDQEYKTKWVYTPLDNNKAGKWYILGYPSELELLGAIQDNQYIYLDPWWDSSWHYKRQINVSTASGSTGTDYQISFNLTYDSDMKSDFSDIRFTNGAENTELNYWIETKSNSNWALVWVKVPQDIDTTNSSIYLYYGNSGASSASSAADTFIFGDDFSTDTTGSWDLMGASASLSWNSGGYFVTAGSGTGGHSHWTHDPNITISDNQRIISRVLTSGSNNVVRVGAGVSDATNVNNDILARIIRAENSRFEDEQISGGAGTNPMANFSLVNGTFYSIQMVKNGNTYMHWDAYKQGNASYSNNLTFMGNLSLSVIGTPIVDLFTRATSGVNLEWDYILVASYSGNVPTVYVGSESMISTSTVNLNTPVNYYNTTSNNIDFDCNATDTNGVINTTLVIDGVSNYTVTNSTPSSNLTLTTTVPVAEGYHIWTCEAYNDVGTLFDASARYFTVDQTNPEILVLAPENNSNTLTNQSSIAVQFNVSVSDNLNLSSCWYYNDSSNVSITCGNNATVTLTGGWHTLIYYANDSAGNLGSNSTTFYINIYNSSLTYTPFVIEGDNTTIYFNITASNITSSNANLSYNGTYYTMTEISNNGTLAQYQRNITVPSVSANTNVTLFVNWTVNGANTVTTNKSQLIYNIPAPVVSTSCSDKAIKFNLVDEGNLTDLNGTYQYNFAYGTPSNNTFSRIYGTISDENIFYLCINSTISNNWSLGEGEIYYTSDGYTDRRYYLFENTTLSNNTQNITLYDLITDDQTSFKLEVEDTSLNPYTEKFTTLVRWYPDLNEYNVVDMGLTDETGSTVIHVKTEDVDYRIGVYEQNGTLIKLANPIRMVCLVSPCTYTLRISPSDTDYTSFFNVDYSLDFNETTGIWTFVFTDTTQTTSEMNLTVYRLTGTSVYPVCSSAVTGYTGAVTCNTSAYTGTLKAIVLRSASPASTFAEKIVEVGTNAFSSTFGLWISMLIAIPIIFIFAFMTPLGAVIGGVISLIPALYFGAINIVILGGIAVLGGIVMHFLKRVS